MAFLVYARHKCAKQEEELGTNTNWEQNLSAKSYSFLVLKAYKPI